MSTLDFCLALAANAGMCFLTGCPCFDVMTGCVDDFACLGNGAAGVAYDIAGVAVFGAGSISGSADMGITNVVLGIDRLAELGYLGLADSIGEVLRASRA